MKLTILGNTPSQKNGKQIFINSRTGKPFITSSKNVKAWHKSANTQLRQIIKEVGAEHFPIQNIVMVSCIFYRKTETAYDLDNAYSTVMDALKIVGIIQDDSVRHVPFASQGHGGKDKDNPRVEVTIIQ